MMKHSLIIAALLMISVSAQAQVKITIFDGVYYTNEIKEITYGTTSDAKHEEALVKIAFKNGDMDERHPYTSFPEIRETDEYTAPQFPGGDMELLKFLTKNLKYPSSCQEAGITGKVLCSFIIREDGKVSDIHIAQSVHPDLDREAKRIVNLMPNWQPAMCNGKAVNAKYTVPVSFRLF